MPRRERVVIGMSGGVDSSVAAWLLKRQGYEVVGVFMKNWEDDDTDEYCTSREDLVDAAAVADVLGIELEAVNFAAEYRERVFALFLRDYAAGRTPNPDVLCNSEIKFRAFLDHALALHADWIATGHYARVRRDASGATELLKAVDASKDQTYFLHRLTQAQLKPALFPLGEITKREVREIAKREGIPTWAKRDSTGICFIGERPFRDFLARYLPRTPGPIVTPEGAQVGRHDGLAYYTLGQRQGLGIGGLRDGAREPWFVAGKDIARNALIAVQGHDHPLLYRSDVDASDLHWISGKAPALPARYAAKTRYRMPDATCSLRAIDAAKGAGGSRVRASFDAPQWAPTPGQYLVLYDGDTCLGGGVIEAPDTGMTVAEAAAGAEVAGIGTPAAASAAAAEDLAQAK
ncbi:MAG: tRNA 2-thiouridine(34) synthase MnmA [Casimicrobiaceae bacterium]